MPGIAEYNVPDGHRDPVEEPEMPVCEVCDEPMSDSTPHYDKPVCTNPHCEDSPYYDPD